MEESLKFTCFVLNLSSLLLFITYKCFFLFFFFCNQIENLLGGQDTFKQRLANHLAPCLAQFAVASGSDAQWKPLNYQVLLKTRHSSAMVSY